MQKGLVGLVVLGVLMVAAQASVGAVPWAVGGVQEPALLQVGELRRLLEPKGVSFAETGILGRYLLEVKFPQTTNALYLRMVSQNNVSYAVFDDLFINLAQVDLGINTPVKVEGWANPVIAIGPTVFRLGTQRNPVNPYLGYMYLVRKRLIDRDDAPPYLAKLLDEDPRARRCIHELPVNDPAGTVYAVASRVWAEANLKAPYDKIPDFAKPAAFHVGAVQNGRIRLLLSRESANYASHLEEWAKARDKETLILIRLTGWIKDLNAEIQVIRPPRGRSQAVRCD
ncbi:hypothetical protein [Meiothermus taiwanensis]|uniref:Uncharacterized protein n=2 Tax=Meiothermus taiwanensis TaxID=172827 RepID=A0A399E1M8_9DEIN|nr:hypothetical protein [Meiothermus taiwanensis]AWR86970.1 hypothetical protein Mtai_v1c17340 [Meiothermus taiwanensis WR-220]KZK16963.1 hypothetical protein A3962_04365 [Meiothermus taiwanensis]RIH76440.1 hypothetical protein Mcate_01782 [Meiothermus taiwanensis]